MGTKSGAIAKKTAAILVISIVLIGSGSYVLWLFETGQLSLFCSGYPPEGNCPGGYSVTFRLLVDYAGPWQAIYFGYRGAQPPSNTVWQTGVGNFTGGNYTGGIFTGTSTKPENVTLSGPNSSGLTLCVQAEKLDYSNSTMTLGINSRNISTSLPHGTTSLCLGVSP